MLIKFEVENFRSINKKVVFHTLQRGQNNFENHIYQHDPVRKLLKFAGVYGPNGAGKTNLFKAIYFVKKMVGEAGFLKSYEGLQLFSQFKLNKQSRFEDSKFKIDFIADDEIYTYSLHVNKELNKITFEHLELLEFNFKGDELISRGNTTIIKRSTFDNNQSKIEMPSQSNLKELVLKYSELISPSESILAFPLIADEEIDKVRLWFSDKLKFLFPKFDLKNLVKLIYKSKDYLQLTNQMIQFAGFPNTKVRIKQNPIDSFFGLGERDLKEKERLRTIMQSDDFYSFEGRNGETCAAVKASANLIEILEIYTVHKGAEGEEINFNIHEESRGTQVLLILIPALLEAYGEEVNYFIDEINVSLHPSLLKVMMSKFMAKVKRGSKGQLIFNSHDEILLNGKIMSQDEFWIIEKNKLDETVVFPLTDFPKISPNSSLKQDYLDGKFGGVPFEEDPGEMPLN